MSKTWPQVKSVLDDPYVSADTKEALLAHWAAMGLSREYWKL